MLRIGSDGGQGLGRGSKQNAVNEIFVLVSDGSDLFRDREDDMKIVRLENFGGSFFNPCGTREGLTLWAVAVTATVVAGPLVLTAAAPFEMTAEGCGTTHLDCGHNRGAPVSWFVRLANTRPGYDGERRRVTAIQLASEFKEAFLQD
jgi:hypothetical protein